MEDHGEYVAGQTEVRRETRLPYADQRFKPPTPEEVRNVLRRLGWTGSRAGLELGVTGRTIRKWTGGDQDVPYSAWRLLLLKAALAIEIEESELQRRVAEN